VILEENARNLIIDMRTLLPLIVSNALTEHAGRNGLVSLPAD
jgi:hypothetical protein